MKKMNGITMWKKMQRGQVVCVSREEVQQALNEMKTEKAPGP